MTSLLSIRNKILMLSLVLANLLFLNVEGYALTEISVPYTNGFIGVKGSNPQQANNIKTFATLGIQRASFVQLSYSGRFEKPAGYQGNDVPGKIRLLLTSGRIIEFSGSIVWTGTGNNSSLFGFLPSANMTPISFTYGNNQTFTINSSSNIGLIKVGASSTDADGDNINGDASTSGVLNDLNSYFTVTENLNPNGPVTVNALSTTNTKPTITGTATMISGETLSVSVNGILYTTAGGNLNVNGNSWSLTIPSANELTVGTYPVTAIITNTAGYMLSDATTNELVINALTPSITTSANSLPAFTNCIQPRSIADHASLTADVQLDGTDVYCIYMGFVWALYKNVADGNYYITAVYRNNSLSFNPLPNSVNDLMALGGSLIADFRNFPGANPQVSYNPATSTITMGNTVLSGLPKYQTFSASGANLTSNITVTAPANFQVSTDQLTWFGSNANPTLQLIPTSGSVASTLLYVRKDPAFTGTSATGNIILSATSAASKNVGTSITDVLPTITLGTIAAVSNTATSFTIPYTNTTNAPTQYTVNVGANALPGFTPIINSVLSASSGNLIIPIPANSAIGTYDFIITVTSASGCSSIDYSKVLTLANALPTDISLSATAIDENNSIGDLVGDLSTTPSGGAFTYTLVSGDVTAFTIAGNQLKAAAPFDFEAKSSYTIRIRTTDAGGLSFEKDFTISVNNVNEAPTNLALSASAIAENNAAGAVIGNLNSSDVDAGDTFGYTLVSGDVTAFTIAGNQLKAAAPFDFETKNSYSIRIKTTDAGGLSFEKDFIISVNNVNEAPTNIALSSSAIAENNSSGAVIGNLSSTDVDAGDTFSYTLVSGDVTAFTISGNQLKAAAPFDFEAKSSYSIRIRTTDAGGLSFEKDFTISVNNVNEAPTNIALSASAIAENNAAGAVIGNLNSSDVDAGDTFGYTLVSGDVTAFTIAGNQLKAAAPFDFETKNSYSIRIKTTDAGGLSFEKDFTISVNNVNEAPTNLALSSSAIAENNAAGAVIGNLSSTEVDAGDTFSYTLLSGDVTAFTIAGNQLKAAATFDFEAKSSYSIRVRTTDAGGLSFEKDFTISVNNVNEAPTNIALSSSAIAENNSAGAVIGNLSSSDVDAGDTFGYTLVSGDVTAFTIAGNQLKAAAPFDFETKSSYTIRIRTTDAGGLSFEKDFTISVNNVNEAPTNLALSLSAIAENNSAGAVIGNLSSSDVDAGDTFGYTLVSGDVTAFTIAGNQLKAAVPFDFETKNSYTIRIRTTDAGGLSFEKLFTISVNNVNEAPTNLALNQTNIFEGNAIGAVIGNLTSTDVDAGDAFTYSLVSGDVTAFTITGNQLKAALPYNFNLKNTYSVKVRTTDAGGLSFEKVFTITVIESPMVSGAGNETGTGLISAFGKDVTISKGFSAKLLVDGKGLTSFSWSPAASLSASNIANPIAKPNQTTTYTITVGNNLGLTTTVYIKVTVIDDFNIVANNVITPNGDGMNDVWVINNIESYPNNEVVVFDKAGRIVFQVKNYKNDWNGMVNGNYLKEGVYYYVITSGTGYAPKKGYINIIHPSN